MNNEIKSGKDILDEFFSELNDNEELDKETVGEILELYKKGKLTERNLKNALSGLREAQGQGNDKN